MKFNKLKNDLKNKKLNLQTIKIPIKWGMDLLTTNDSMYEWLFHLISTEDKHKIMLEYIKIFDYLKSTQRLQAMLSLLSKSQKNKQIVYSKPDLLQKLVSDALDPSSSIREAILALEIVFRVTPTNHKNQEFLQNIGLNSDFLLVSSLTFMQDIRIFLIKLGKPIAKVTALKIYKNELVMETGESLIDIEVDYLYIPDFGGCEFLPMEIKFNEIINYERCEQGLDIYVDWIDINKIEMVGLSENYINLILKKLEKCSVATIELKTCFEQGIPYRFMDERWVIEDEVQKLSGHSIESVEFGQVSQGSSLEHYKSATDINTNSKSNNADSSIKNAQSENLSNKPQSESNRNNADPETHLFESESADIPIENKLIPSKKRKIRKGALADTKVNKRSKMDLFEEEMEELVLANNDKAEKNTNSKQDSCVRKPRKLIQNIMTSDSSLSGLVHQIEEPVDQTKSEIDNQPTAHSSSSSEVGNSLLTGYLNQKSIDQPKKDIAIEPVKSQKFISEKHKEIYETRIDPNCQISKHSMSDKSENNGEIESNIEIPRDDTGIKSRNNQTANPVHHTTTLSNERVTHQGSPSSNELFWIQPNDITNAHKLAKQPTRYASSFELFEPLDSSRNIQHTISQIAHKLHEKYLMYLQQTVSEIMENIDKLGHDPKVANAMKRKMKKRIKVNEELVACISELKGRVLINTIE